MIIVIKEKTAAGGYLGTDSKGTLALFSSDIATEYMNIGDRIKGHFQGDEGAVNRRPKVQRVVVQ